MLRSCNAVLVDLPRTGAVARVEHRGGPALSARIAASARLFARCGAPTIRLLYAADAVTIWPRLTAVRAVTPRELGAVIRDLHERSAGALAPDLPALDPFVELAALLADAARDPRWPAADVDRLRDLAAAHARRWHALAGDDPLGPAVVHGDVHRNNVIVTADGPVLIDLELAGVGPRTWDFVQLGAAVHRYGREPAALDDFIAGYGADPRRWEGFVALRDGYELLSAVWAAAFRRRDATFAREAELRVAGVLGRSDAAWTLL
ncbi:MAG: phosphotransferase [Nannocystaceae bacterium]